MIRIAFISANQYAIPYPVYPIGVSYLMTYIRNRLPEAEVELFDCGRQDMEALGAFCRKAPWNLIGVSLRNIDDVNIFEKNCFVAHYQRVMRIIREESDAPVVIGGPAFSIFPEALFRTLRPDFGIIGEGEETLFQLVQSVVHRRPYEQIEGLVWQDGEDNVTINPHVSYISAPEVRFDPEAVPYYYANSGMLNVQTKRGCPFHCIYCTYPLIDGRTVRTLDARTVVANIEEAWFKHQVSYFFFTDSVFNIHPAYNEELARRLIESRAKIRWGAYFSPYKLTYNELKLYQDAGLTHIEWGTDTLSDQQLINYGKNFTFEDIRRTSRYAEELGIFYAHFLILGGYGETDETLQETFSRSATLGPTVFFPFIGMRIYPRTALYDIAVREGVIADQTALVNPVYYVSPHADLSRLAVQARATGATWIFPDDDHSEMMLRFRKKKIRGPLWEYLRYTHSMPQ